MRLVIIGAGYVGLVSAACLAEMGHSVVCIDTDQSKIDKLKSGGVPIYEPGLEELVARNMHRGLLSFCTELAPALAGVDAVFVAVGTPSRRGDGQADLSYVFGAAGEVARGLTDYAVIVTKSTVPIGTNKTVARIVREARPDLEFDVVSNPEFLREGVAIDDFLQPDRVVVGVESERAEQIMREVYAPLAAEGFPIVFTDIESAEMIKYAANAFLAMKITFINEVAGLCERVGADVTQVARAVGMDARIGERFLAVGPGYGGSCFPKDTLAFARTGQSHGFRLQMVESTIEVNRAIKLRMVDKIVSACGGTVSEKRIAVLGVTFKADTDDMREAPSLTIIPELMRRGAEVSVVDPQGRHEGEKLLPGVTWCEDAYAMVAGADALVVLTDWSDFRDLDLARMAGKMRVPALIDLRNIYDEDAVREAGFGNYSRIGRGEHTAILQGAPTAISV